MRQILSFLGFGRSERLARMRRKATDRLRRAYGPTFGFYPSEYRTAVRVPDSIAGWIPYHLGMPEETAGNVRIVNPGGMVRGYREDTYGKRTSRPAPYRAGWGIPV